jgi:hypothetical protein
LHNLKLDSLLELTRANPAVTTQQRGQLTRQHETKHCLPSKGYIFGDTYISTGRNRDVRL